MNANEVLQKRQVSHGDFSSNAKVSQLLKSALRWGCFELDDDQQESLEMICLKISRIATGNPNEPDHWLDIAGYATLVYNRLMEDHKDVVGRNECHTVLHTDGGDRYNTNSLDLDKLGSDADPMGGL